MSTASSCSVHSATMGDSNTGSSGNGGASDHESMATNVNAASTSNSGDGHAEEGPNHPALSLDASDPTNNGDAVIEVQEPTSLPHQDSEASDDATDWWEDYLKELAAEPYPDGSKSAQYSNSHQWFDRSNIFDGSWDTIQGFREASLAKLEQSWFIKKKSDIVFMSTKIETEPSIIAYDFRKKDSVRAFEQEHKTYNRGIIIIPDLSPVVMEIVSKALGPSLNPHAFVQHIRAGSSGPFEFEDKQEHPYLLGPKLPNTLTLDCDIDEFISEYNYDFPKGNIKCPSSFLQRKLQLWPRSMATSKGSEDPVNEGYGISRFTLHVAGPAERPTVLILLTPYQQLIGGKPRFLMGHSSLVATNVVPFNFNHTLRSRATSIVAAPPYLPGIKQEILSCEGVGDQIPLLSALYDQINGEEFQSLENPASIVALVRDIQKIPASSMDQNVNLYLGIVMLLSKGVTKAFHCILFRDTMRLKQYARYHENKKEPSATGEKGYDPIRGLRMLEERCMRRKSVLHELICLLSEIIAGRSEDSMGVLGESISSLKTEIQDLERAVDAFYADIELEMARTSTDLNHALTVLQIEESQRAIAQNHLVRKLTILAFLFIPLSTVSSVFGMNVTEFRGDGAPKLWMFGVSALAVTLAAILLIAISPLIDILIGLALDFRPFGEHTRKIIPNLTSMRIWWQGFKLAKSVAKSSDWAEGLTVLRNRGRERVQFEKNLIDRRRHGSVDE